MTNESKPKKFSAEVREPIPDIDGATAEDRLIAFLQRAQSGERAFFRRRPSKAVGGYTEIP